MLVPEFREFAELRSPGDSIHNHLNTRSDS